MIKAFVADLVRVNKYRPVWTNRRKRSDKAAC
jgi:hypothetical protein